MAKTIKLTGAMIALCAALFTIAYFIRTRPVAFIDQATITIPVELSHPLQEHFWIAETEMLVAGRENDVFDVRSLNIQTKQMSGCTELANILSGAAPKSTALGLQWVVSPGGRAICFVQTTDNAVTISEKWLEDKRVETQAVLKQPTAGLTCFWNSNRRQWTIVTQITNKTFLIRPKELAGKPIELPLPSADYYPIGFSARDSLDFIAADLKNSSVVHLINVELSAEPRISHRSDIKLPFSSMVEMAKLSPDGEQILWKVRQVRLNAEIITSMKFPFVRIGKTAEPVGSVWVSNAEGNHFTELGELGPRDPIGSNLEWCPSGKYISSLYNGNVLIWSIARSDRVSK